MPEPKYNREDYKKTGLIEDKPNAQDISEHLDELRNRILIVFVCILLLFILAFYFSEILIQVLQATAPKGSSFFQIKPGELFMTTMKVSAYFALTLSLPVISWQTFMFLKPGLNEKESKVLMPITIAAPMFFWGGQIFSYFLILPPLMKFLLQFRENVVASTYSLEHFLNLELSLITVCGITFLLPVLIIILGHLGMVNSQQLFSVWQYVILIAFVVSAVITPTPDPLTMSILAIALICLYFLTVIILKISKK